MPPPTREQGDRRRPHGEAGDDLAEALEHFGADQRIVEHEIGHRADAKESERGYGEPHDGATVEGDPEGLGLPTVSSGLGGAHVGLGG